MSATDSDTDATEQVRADIRRAARIAVCARAHDVAEAHELLAMLGLLPTRAEVPAAHPVGA